MRHSQMSRVVLAAFGLLVVLGGLVAWSWEDEYGSGFNFLVERAQRRHRNGL
jgi:hypothetical protein